MDDVAFARACEAATAAQVRGGIGTLGEKTLHAALKFYFEPDAERHEQKLGTFVADIVTPDRVIEIQTRGFTRLRKKLAVFLARGPVTVVYPVPRTKWLLWVDPDTGAVSSRRKSPKQGGVFDAVRELYQIKPLLTHPNLRLCVVLLDVEEYRYLNGWSADRKRGSVRCDRLPLALVQEIYLSCPADYSVLIPPALGEPFTSKDLQKAARTTLRTAQTALNLLHHMGLVTRVGKQGNAHCYVRAEQTCQHYEI